MQRLNKFREEHAELFSIIIMFLCYLLLLGILSVVFPQRAPTLEQAAAQILRDHPQCVNTLQVTKAEQQFGFTGPLPNPVVAYFLECPEVARSIRIQRPANE